MSNLVEIQAECLRWCPYGFEFTYGVIKCHYKNSTSDFIYSISDIFLVDFEAVLVNPAEYTKAVVGRLKELLPELSKVRKYRTIKGDTVVIAFASDTIVKVAVTINADVQPWLDEYTLEVQ